MPVCLPEPLRLHDSAPEISRKQRKHSPKKTNLERRVHPKLFKQRGLRRSKISLHVSLCVVLGGGEYYPDELLVEDLCAADLDELVKRGLHFP